MKRRRRANLQELADQQMELFHEFIEVAELHHELTKKLADVNAQVSATRAELRELLRYSAK